MESPPFDVALMLAKEFGEREGWEDVLEEASKLALELDAVLVRNTLRLKQKKGTGVGMGGWGGSTYLV